MHDFLVAVDGDAVVDRWDVIGRTRAMSSCGEGADGGDRRAELDQGLTLRVRLRPGARHRRALRPRVGVRCRAASDPAGGADPSPEARAPVRGELAPGVPRPRRVRGCHCAPGRGDPDDIVSIVTPDHLHGVVLHQVLEAGVPMIHCKKPLATSLGEADAMITAVAVPAPPWPSTTPGAGTPTPSRCARRSEPARSASFPR